MLLRVILIERTVSIATRARKRHHPKLIFANLSRPRVLFQLEYFQLPGTLIPLWNMHLSSQVPHRHAHLFGTCLSTPLRCCPSALSSTP